jgi:hypothetical protein
MGRDGTGHAIRPTAILHRLPEAGRAVRRLGGGLSAIADQPECAQEARPARHRAAVCAGRPPPLRTHHRAALRSGEPAFARHAQGSQRGLGAPRPDQDRRSGRPDLAAKPPGLLHFAAAERAVGARYGQHDGQHGKDLVRPSGRRRGWLPSAQAWASFARRSHLHAVEPAIGAAGRCAARRRI